MSFLVKGFFSKGLEQLLWHITALEALFGEDRPGLTQLMARRVALVLGETETQKKEISNHFEELYKLRSRLVHGSELKSEVWEGQLKVARDLTRRSLLWFLSFLVEFSKVGKCLPPEILAERKELLAVIDSHSGAIIQLAKILKSVSCATAWAHPCPLLRGDGAHRVACSVPHAAWPGAALSISSSPRKSTPAEIVHPVGSRPGRAWR